MCRSGLLAQAVDSEAASFRVSAKAWLLEVCITNQPEETLVVFFGGGQRLPLYPESMTPLSEHVVYLILNSVLLHMPWRYSYLVHEL